MRRLTSVLCCFFVLVGAGSAAAISLKNTGEGGNDPVVPEDGCAECPLDGQIEGEPLCADGYVDVFNGGCNSEPPVFTDVRCGTICGETGGFRHMNMDFRDTDWYTITVGPGAFSYTAIGQLPLTVAVLDPVCPASVIEIQTTDACVQSTPINFNGPGTFYLFCAVNGFGPSFPCGSDYVMTITGPGVPSCSPTPVEISTWGSIKSVYR